MLAPIAPAHGTARANLKAAFPEKSDAEIGKILNGMWDNLGRIGAEFAHLDHIWKYDPTTPQTNSVEFTPRTDELFQELKNDGKGALIFASHLGNWELPALAAVWVVPAVRVSARGLEHALLVHETRHCVLHGFGDLCGASAGLRP